MVTLKHYLLFLGMYGVGISLVLGWVVALAIPKRYAKHVDTLAKPLTYVAFILRPRARFFICSIRTSLTI